MLPESRWDDSHHTLRDGAAVLSALRAGDRITPRDALQRFGTMRLGARIYDLKAMGYAIKMEMLRVGLRPPGIIE